MGAAVGFGAVAVLATPPPPPPRQVATGPPGAEKVVAWKP